MKQKQKKKSSSSDLEKIGIDPETDQKIDDFMKVFESDEWKSLEEDLNNLQFDEDFDKAFENFDFDF